MLVLAGRLWVALIFSDSTSQSSQFEVALAQGLLRLGVQIQLLYRAARGQLGRRGPPGHPGPSPPRVWTRPLRLRHQTLRMAAGTRGSK